MILNLVCRKPPDELPSFTPDIEAALHYIHSNIREELSLETIAAQTGLSLSQFKLKFRQQTGSPPRVYINRLKIELSKAMLLAGKTKTESPWSLAFSTSSYFTSVFRKYTACTPSGISPKAVRRNRRRTYRTIAAAYRRKRIGRGRDSSPSDLLYVCQSSRPLPALALLQHSGSMRP